VLLLRFWIDDPASGWIPVYEIGGEGGHYVTCAGVNSTTFELLICDPWIDAFELGHRPGRMPVPHPAHGDPTIHNDAQYVSHDAYPVSLWTSPPFPYPSPYVIPAWELVGILGNYGFPPNWHAFIEAAVVTSPSGVHDVAVTDAVTFKTVCQETFSPINILYEGYTVNINATVENQGDFAETFDVTAKYDGNIIQTLAVSLPAHTSTVVTFTWDTTAVVHGNYTLSVEAEVVSGETDISDNTYTNGWVVVTLLGDIDGDFDIDEDDLWIFAGAWIIYYSSGVKNPLCDFDEDCDIDEDDLWAFASAWIDYYS
jgi:hypothetical protein